MTTKRKYRKVEADRAGYAPGMYLVQYWDPEARVWFDDGDPLPEIAALDRLDARRKEAGT